MTTPFDAAGLARHEASQGPGPCLITAQRCRKAATIVAGWDRRSAEMRARHSLHLDLNTARASVTASTSSSGERAPTLVFHPRRLLADARQGGLTLFAEAPMAHASMSR